MPLPAETLRRARRVALENAIDHDGVARTGPILSRLLAQDPALRSELAALQAAVGSIVAEVATLPVSAQREELARLGGAELAPPKATEHTTGTFPELPGAERGKVVLRLAPFPSGALHIGSGRLLYVNDYYRQRYAGKVFLVFDDTIGSEEKRVESEFFDLILDDLKLAGIPTDAVYYKSDRVPLFYPWARRVIETGGAYVCRCPAETLRSNRAAGIECPERRQAIAETLDEWQTMLDGGYREGEAVLRLRTDLHDPDPAFRDRVLFRISEAEHPRVGHRYRVWPLLEFSWAVDDIELGITHVLRGKDLVMEDRVQRYIWDLLGIRGPPFLHWGLLRVREAKVSKSKSYKEVTTGVYDGWADPRTWSLRSLERRGISMDALRQFILSFGLSLADIEVPAETLYSENRALLDATTPRRQFVGNPVRVDVTGYPDGLARVDLANHPDRLELGTRTVTAGPSFYLARTDLAARVGAEIRLKDLANVELPPTLPSPGEPMTARFTSRENKKLPRFQWVGADGAVPVEMLLPDGSRTSGLAEQALATTAPGEILQFERVGFVRVDTVGPSTRPPVRVVFGHP